jgi:hypothetical protein
MRAIFAQSHRGVEDALEMRIAHADLVHVVERIADVVDAWTARADSLGDQARAPVQVELAHVRRMRRIGDERKRAHCSCPNLYRDQARLVDPARHLAVPESRERAAQARRVNSVGHAPARAAAAQAHDEAGLAARAALAGGEDAERAVVAVDPAERLLPKAEARRPHERAVAEHPDVALRQPGHELVQRHAPSI